MLFLSSFFFFFSSRRRHTRLQGDWSSDVCSSDLRQQLGIRRLAQVVRIEIGEFGHVEARGRAADAGKRSEERRVGKEWRTRWGPEHWKQKGMKRTRRDYRHRMRA